MNPISQSRFHRASFMIKHLIIKVTTILIKNSIDLSKSSLNTSQTKHVQLIYDLVSPQLFLHLLFHLIVLNAQLISYSVELLLLVLMTF